MLNAKSAERAPQIPPHKKPTAQDKNAARGFTSAFDTKVKAHPDFSVIAQSPLPTY